MESLHDVDVIIIGAGPSGTVAASLLNKKGYRVEIIEKQHFPRFSIGESLLPQCMVFLEEAGLSNAVHEAAPALGFQYKDGATFHCGNKFGQFDFNDKFSAGPATTYQVRRADFDHLLAKQVEQAGVPIIWGAEVTDVTFTDDYAELKYLTEQSETIVRRAQFILDASGFGRVLPRLLDLSRPSDFPVRTSIFTHIEDRIVEPQYDRNKIRIITHPQHKEVWFWLIPFADGRCSFGVVAENHFFEEKQGDELAVLKQFLNEDPDLQYLLNNAVFDTGVKKITAYSSNVSTLYGERFALLGNAGEFLDPVFSSGVTIAMKSASLAANLLDKQFQGGTVDWEQDYSVALKKGVDTFRDYVEAWYDGGFQDIIFAPYQHEDIRKMVCSILAGYAWDIENTFVKHSKRRLKTLVELCQSQMQPVD